MNKTNTEGIDLQQLVKDKETVSLDLFKEIQSEFWYLTRLFTRQSTTGQSEGRSISAEAKTQSKKYSSGLLQEVILLADQHAIDNKDNFKKACQRVIQVHEDNQKKIDTERHLENLRLILVPVYQKSEEIIREQYKDTRQALTRSFDNVKEIVDRMNIEVFKPDLYKKRRFNSADIYPLIQKEACDCFGCDFEERIYSVAQRRNIEAARRFVADVANCFRFGLTATLDKNEQDHFDVQIAKLESNLVKYIPIGIDEISNFEINEGPKGFELTGDLLSKGTIKHKIRTFAHAAGGWNIQSFHYRYKTNLFDHD